MKMRHITIKFQALVTEELLSKPEFIHQAVQLMANELQRGNLVSGLDLDKSGEYAKYVNHQKCKIKVHENDGIPGQKAKD